MRHRPVLLIGSLLVVAFIAGPASASDLGSHGVEIADDREAASSYQVSGCFSDPAGDVKLGPDGGPVDSPQADITEFCIDYSDSGLGLSMTVAGGTDPLSDPTWNDFGAAVAFLYRTAEDTLRTINFGKQRGNQTFEYYVLEGQFSVSLVCAGAAQFTAGTYTATIPADCINGPDTIRVLSEMFYDTAGGIENANFDLGPVDGGYVSIPRAQSDAADNVTRLAGSNRIETAIATSMASYPSGGAGAVLLADAGNFPDAVVGAPLAAARQAPVLLTPRESVPEEVREEIQRALGGTGDVILLGGTAALSDTVRTTLEDDGHNVTRVSGDSRFSTSVAVAEAANDAPGTIFLAGGGDFANALLAGATSPSLNGVAVLVDSGGVPAGVQSYLDANPDAQTIAVGKSASVAVPDADTSIAGDNPAINSAALLQSFPDPQEIAFATFENFPDGLSGGAYAASRGIPMLLSAREGMDGVVLDALAKAGPFPQITFFGGVAALNDTVAGQAGAFVG